MKTAIGTYKPRTSIRIGLGDLVGLEMVLRRHISREYSRRNLQPFWARGLQRIDIRDAVSSLRTIKNSKVQYHVD